MFLAFRDLRFAKGRFTLMTSALFLISLMVVMLSGLTSGLGNRSIAAIENIGADHFAFGAPPDGRSVSFAESTVTTRQYAELAKADGVDAASIIGVAPARISVDGREVAASAFGVDGHSFAAPVVLGAGSVAVDADLANDNGWTNGTRISMSGKVFTITALVDDSFYSHQPVVWMDHDAWMSLPSAGGSDGTVVALRTSAGFDADSVGEATGTAVTDGRGALNAIGSYTSERGSLLLMQTMLMIVSALVVGAFFTVWTIQRGQDLAVLKAVGASTRYLLQDALGQSSIVLVLGSGLGTLAAAGLGTAASQSVPFSLTMSTTVVPFLALVATGMIGAAASLVRIAKVDPLAALAAAR
ncbi:ABC transporter permease [Rhodococcus pyridinivorans]|uniref:ABC transporter permease n=1 Tax=Rhodococcus pyridinivorans TaxID=103816 RepID=UPI00200A62AC|nr:ABC transporter permease [Rhodococcus pyridinivorans]UPW03209.1 ABC transporter permease [Rhodococcus pyridinivorans]